MEKLSEIKQPLKMKKKDENDEAIDHDKLAYSVSKGYGTSNNYFTSYLIRTIAELIISTGLFVWLIIRGYEPLFAETDNSQARSIKRQDFWAYFWGNFFHIFINKKEKNTICTL